VLQRLDRKGRRAANSSLRWRSYGYKDIVYESLSGAAAAAAKDLELSGKASTATCPETLWTPRHADERCDRVRGRRDTRDIGSVLGGRYAEARSKHGQRY